MHFEAWIVADKKTADFSVVSTSGGTLHDHKQISDSMHVISGVFFCETPSVLKVVVQSATKSLTVQKGSFLRVSQVGPIR